jgi:hypothetical protein
MVQHLRPPYVQNPRPKRILVIGGGIAGVAALRALVEENGVGKDDSPFTQVELIERRDNVGGVWYLDDQTVTLEKSFTKGNADGQWPVYSDNSALASSSSSKPYWPSPAYPALRGNVLPRFLSLAGADPFPAPSTSKEAHGNRPGSDARTPFDPFPTLAETHAYIERVAKPLRTHVRCNVECVGVWELPDPDNVEGGNKWAVQIRDWNANGEERTEFWDAIIMTVGWTDSPSYPRSPGLEQARAAGFIEHCKWYRGPEPYSRHERIVIIGNGNSGNDVCAQLAAQRASDVDEPIYRICRHKAYFFYVSLADPMIRDMPAVERFEVIQVKGKNVLNIHLIDGQGIERVDRVISAVGYQVGVFPFVHVLNDREWSLPEAQALCSTQGKDSTWQPDTSLYQPWRAASSAPSGTQFEDDSGSNPSRVSGLYMHILHARASTLAFVNLTVTSIPFWTSDFQSHCIRAIWDGSHTLPSRIEDRLTYERNRIAFIRSLHEKKVEALLAATEEQRERQARSDAIRREQGLQPLYEPPEAIDLMPYHVLGTRVADYFAAMRKLAIDAKPSWDDKLPDFSNYQDTHDGMYGLKYRTLEAKKAAQLNGR